MYIDIHLQSSTYNYNHTPQKTKRCLQKKESPLSRLRFQGALAWYCHSLVGKAVALALGLAAPKSSSVNSYVATDVVLGPLKWLGAWFLEEIS